MKNRDLPSAVDVVVVGSGAAALSAALKAAGEGLSVAVLEKSEWLGGTSAMSGAGTWIPANHLMKQAGFHDSPAEALEYLRATAPEGWAQTEDHLWRAFANAAPELLKFLEQRTPLKFELMPEPDPFTELPGGKKYGRMLSPSPLSKRLIGSYGARVRPSTLPHRFSYGDNFKHDIFHHPIRSCLAMAPTLLKRFLRNEWGQGTSLVIGLLKGCLDSGCSIFTDAEAKRLVQVPSGAISGVEVLYNGSRHLVSARFGVVIATGGFEWDSNRLAKHFPGANGLLGSPRSNTGDGHRMAEEVGASLERMDQANIYPVLPTRYQGKLHGLPITFQATPNCIVVNSQAKRFCSEYDFNLGESLDTRDVTNGIPRNCPSWIIGDQRFVNSSPAIRFYAAKLKGWLIKAGSLEELSRKIGLPTQELIKTVNLWNGYCASNHDADFKRGESVWERYKSHWTDGDVKNPALGTICKGPFYAVRFDRSMLGTKGGPRTNEFGEVLRRDGSVIEGLYCAGVAMANCIGTRAVGPGTTIGPCMTWGYICADNIVKKLKSVAQTPEVLRFSK